MGDYESFRESVKNYSKHWNRVCSKTLNDQKKMARLISLEYLEPNEKCIICGSIKNLILHHPNYNNPLMTVTVCHLCHLEAHSKNINIQYSEEYAGCSRQLPRQRFFTAKKTETEIKRIQAIKNLRKRRGGGLPANLGFDKCYKSYAKLPCQALLKENTFCMEETPCWRLK